MFEFSVANEGGWDIEIEESDFKLKDEEGDKHEPQLVTVDGHVATQKVEEDERVAVRAVFEVPEGVAPTELKYNPSFGFRNNVRYVFR